MKHAIQTGRNRAYSDKGIILIPATHSYLTSDSTVQTFLHPWVPAVVFELGKLSKLEFLLRITENLFCI